MKVGARCCVMAGRRRGGSLSNGSRHSMPWNYSPSSGRWIFACRHRAALARLWGWKSATARRMRLLPLSVPRKLFCKCWLKSTSATLGLSPGQWRKAVGRGGLRYWRRLAKRVRRTPPGLQPPVSTYGGACRNGLNTRHRRRPPLTQSIRKKRGIASRNYWTRRPSRGRARRIMHRRRRGLFDRGMSRASRISCWRKLAPASARRSAILRLRVCGRRRTKHRCGSRLIHGTCNIRSTRNWTAYIRTRR